MHIAFSYLPTTRRDDYGNFIFFCARGRGKIAFSLCIFSLCRRVVVAGAMLAFVCAVFHSANIYTTGSFLRLFWDAFAVDLKANCSRSHDLLRQTTDINGKLTLQTIEQSALLRTVFAFCLLGVFVFAKQNRLFILQLCWTAPHRAALLYGIIVRRTARVRLRSRVVAMMTALIAMQRDFRIVVGWRRRDANP